MKIPHHFFTLAMTAILTSCLSNNDRCIRRLFEEAGVAEEKTNQAKHLVVMQGSGCESCIRKAFSEMHESEDTIYIVSCRSEKAFKLIAQQNIENFSNVYLDRRAVAADMGMVKNTPVVYVLKKGKYVSHHYYGQKETTGTTSLTSLATDRTEIDLGTFRSDEDKICRFTLHNTGNDTLRIDRTDLSCECLTIIKEIKTIAPGEKAILEIVFHPDTKGAFEREVLVFGNFTSSPTSLRLSGECL